MPEQSTSKPLLHDPAVYDATIDRIERLTPDATPRWGEMSVARMLAHCTEVQRVLNGVPLEGTPWYIRLSAPIVKRAVLSDRPFPRGIPTHPQYEVPDEREFETEKRRLLEALQAFRSSNAATRPPHTLFGRLTDEQAGWVGYKHLDHHLTQFGV